MDTLLAGHKCPRQMTPEAGSWAVQWSGCLSGLVALQNLGSKGYEEKKEQVVDSIVERLQSYFPGLKDGILFRCDCRQGLEARAHMAPVHGSWLHVHCAPLPTCCIRVYTSSVTTSPTEITYHCAIMQGGGHTSHTQALPGSRRRLVRPHPLAAPAWHAGHAHEPHCHQGEPPRPTANMCSVVARRSTNKCRGPDRLTLMLMAIQVCSTVMWQTAL
jgi:hypothetical protein